MRRYGCQERLVARSRSERPNDRPPDRNETPVPAARNGGRLNGEFIIRTGGREGERERKAAQRSLLETN